MGGARPWCGCRDCPADGDPGVFFGHSRILVTVARDGLLPISLARVSRRGTPVRIATIFTAVVTSAFAGLIPLAAIAALANAGTSPRSLLFVQRCSVRRREPDRERKFRAPLASLVGTIGILGCIYLFISLPNGTQIFFVTAQVIGLFLYGIYGSGAAERAREAS